MKCKYLYKKNIRLGIIFTCIIPILGIIGMLEKYIYINQL